MTVKRSENNGKLLLPNVPLCPAKELEGKSENTKESIPPLCAPDGSLESEEAARRGGTAIEEKAGEAIDEGLPLHFPTDSEREKEGKIGLKKVLAYVKNEKFLSVSKLQKKFRISYEDAEEIIGELCECGFIYDYGSGEKYGVNNFLASLFSTDY